MFKKTLSLILFLAIVLYPSNIQLLSFARVSVSGEIPDGGYPLGQNKKIDPIVRRRNNEKKRLIRYCCFSVLAFLLFVSVVQKTLLYLLTDLNRKKEPEKKPVTVVHKALSHPEKPVTVVHKALPCIKKPQYFYHFGGPQSDDGETHCAICKKDFKIKEKVFRHGCNSTSYHYDCIVKYLKTRISLNLHTNCLFCEKPIHIRGVTV